MANMNTCFALYNLAGPVSATETAVAIPGSTTTRQLLGLTNDVNGGLFDGKPFKVRVVAQGVATGASNFTVNLYWNSAANTNLTTFTSDILVQGSGAQALASKTGTVFVESVCVWDSGLAQLSSYNAAPGGFSSLVTTPNLIGATAAKANTSGVIASSGVATPNLVQFFVTLTCSTAANVTSTKILEFAIDHI